MSGRRALINASMLGAMAMGVLVGMALYRLLGGA